MDKASREFIERMGTVAEEDGFPRIAGRLLGYLLLEEGPFSLDHLATELQVSKPSISVNARRLEELGLLERVGEPGDRRDYYRLGANPWERAAAIARARLQRMHDVLAVGRSSMPEGTERRRRLAEWQHFYAFLLDDLGTKVERWRAYRAQREAVGADSVE